MRNTLFLLSTALVLSACTTAPFPPATSQQNLGSVQLMQTLVVAPDKARVLVQQGKVVTRIDERDPSCVFEHWQVSAEEKTLQVDTFRIAELSQRTGDVGRGFGVYGSTDLGMGIGFGLNGVGVAGQPTAMGNVGMGRFGDGPRQAQAATIMRLVSAKQPMLYRLTCFSATAWSTFVDPPAEQDINQILGNIGQVTLQKP
jgi:hypothetical protein